MTAQVFLKIQKYFKRAKSVFVFGYIHFILVMGQQNPKVKNVFQS